MPWDEDKSHLQDGGGMMMIIIIFLFFFILRGCNAQEPGKEAKRKCLNSQRAFIFVHIFHLFLYSNALPDRSSICDFRYQILAFYYMPDVFSSHKDTFLRF